MKAPELPSDEGGRLRALGRYQILDTPMERAFDEITELASHIAGTPIALVSLVDAERQWFKSRVGLDAAQTPRSISFCGHVVADGQPLVVNSADDARFADNPLVTGGPNVAFYAGMPLRTSDGHVLGTLCTIDNVPRELSPEVLAMLQKLANQVVRLLEQRRQVRVLSRYRKLFDSPTVLPLILDPDGRVRDSNHAWSVLSGAVPAEMAGKPIVDFAHPEDRAGLRHFMEGTVEEASQHGYTGRLVAVDGSFRWLTWTAIYDEPEAAIYALARDVTAERKLQEAKDGFVAMVSHDLRTPLTSINGSLRLLEGGVMGPLEPDAAKLVAVSRRACDRLVTMVSELLDIDKFESGRLKLQLERVTARGLMARAAEGVSGYAHDCGVRIEIDEGEATVRAEPGRVVQILTNLLSNSIRFSPKGGVVRLSVRPGDGMVRFEVQDEGPGIPPKLQRALFERYVQGDTLTSSGSGLGLALCRALTEAHSGRIGVESTVGVGSTFWFSLPAV